MTKKRANGEGTTYKRADGKWCASRYVEADNGKRKRVYVYGKTQAEVKKKLKELNFMEENHVSVLKGKVTLENWMEDWMMQYKKPILKQSTFENYRLNINVHVRGTAVGKKVLNAVTTNDLQKFYNALLEPKNRDKKSLSVRTVKYIRTIVGSALEQAVKNGMIMKNPNDATVMPREHRKEIKPLAVGEVKQLLDTVKGEPIFPLILLECTTGLRKGEILGLRWGDIDFVNKELTVNKSLSRVEKEDKADGVKTELILTTPKTEKSIRTIPLPNNVIEALLIHKEKQEKNKEEYQEIWQELDMVFCRADGYYYCPRQLLKDFHAALDKAGIRKCRFHDLRHTVASMLLNAGMDVKDIQELLGHSTITTTLDVYSHISKQRRQQVGNTIQMLLEENP